MPQTTGAEVNTGSLLIEQSSAMASTWFSKNTGFVTLANRSMLLTQWGKKKSKYEQIHT